MRKIIFAVCLLIIGFLVAWTTREVMEFDEYKGARTWTHILDRVVQAEADALYLERCLYREVLLEHQLWEATQSADKLDNLPKRMEKGL